MTKSNVEMKTNAVRLVEQAGVAFELRQYDVDENNLMRVTAAQLAHLARVSVEKQF